MSENVELHRVAFDIHYNPIFSFFQIAVLNSPSKPLQQEPQHAKNLPKVGDPVSRRKNDIKGKRAKDMKPTENEFLYLLTL